MLYWSLIFVLCALSGVMAISFALTGIAVVLFAIAAGMVLVIAGKAMVAIANRAGSRQENRTRGPVSRPRDRRTSQESSRVM